MNNFLTKVRQAYFSPKIENYLHLLKLDGIQTEEISAFNGVFKKYITALQGNFPLDSLDIGSMYYFHFLRFFAPNFYAALNQMQEIVPDVPFYQLLKDIAPRIDAVRGETVFQYWTPDQSLSLADWFMLSEWPWAQDAKMLFALKRNDIATQIVEKNVRQRIGTSASSQDQEQEAIAQTLTTIRTDAELERAEERIKYIAVETRPPGPPPKHFLGSRFFGWGVVAILGAATGVAAWKTFFVNPPRPSKKLQYLYDLYVLKQE